MRAVLQRVSQAQVEVKGEVIGKIDGGLLALVAAGKEDDESHARKLADKIAGLRIFADDQGKMNRSVLDIGGGVLVVSQFTLFGDARKGRRPSFIMAGEPERARQLYEQVIVELKALGIAQVESGRFQADMQVSLVNDGPVTLLIDTHKSF